MEGALKQELVKQIENLKAHAKIQCLDSASAPGVKVLEDIGDHVFVIKFLVFNKYDINLTIQITSKQKIFGIALRLNQVF